MFSIDDPKVLGPTRLRFSEERDVDLFLETLEKFERGEIDPDAWRAFRLVNGVYGQRQEGVSMIRVKIPLGALSPAQLLAMADVAERWSTGKGHLTTRQNMQFHFVKLPDTELALRHMAAVGLTTREACGNAVRNVTGCPFMGTSAHEPFDAAPYAEALTRYLLRGPLSASLPRKFKIAFSGCCGTDCVVGAINDLGFFAKEQDGKRGFLLRIGGGTSTMPRAGFVAHDFLAAEEILEAAEAVVRIFHRLGNRKNRAQARLKFVIEKLKVEGFLAEYRKEREIIRAEGGRPYEVPPAPEYPERAPSAPEVSAYSPEFQRFAAHNVREQKQPGFVSVLVRLHLGDISVSQMRTLAELAVRYADGDIRTTHDQNFVLRFVPAWRAPALYRELQSVGLGQPDAGTISDVTSCPGASSCKLAVTASRGLADLLGRHLTEHPEQAAKAKGMNIKISGCPNGCGQHHIAGIGFQGGLRKIDGKAAPHYHLLLGAKLDAKTARFGKMVAKFPARRAPAVLDRLLDWYGEAGHADEGPEDFFARQTPKEVAARLGALLTLEPAEATPEDFIDLGETAAFTGETTEGECAA
jgi:sulfite reductase (NADPH) hemoprotein beta-component